MPRPLLRLLLILVLCIGWSSAASAHFGSSGRDLMPQLRVVPSVVEDVNAVFLSIDGMSVTRAEFLNYIRNIVFGQIRTDSVQREVLSHLFALNEYSHYSPLSIDPRVPMEDGSPFDANSTIIQERIQAWLETQAKVLAVLIVAHRDGEKAKLSKDPAMVDRLNFFETAVRAEFMEAFVGATEADPTVEGIRKHVASIKAADQRAYESTFARADLRDATVLRDYTRRWVQYRRDLVNASALEPSFEEVNEITAKPKTVLIKVNKHKFTFGQFLNIYGKLPTDSFWNARKKQFVNYVGLQLALGDEAERLDVLPDHFRRKTELFSKLILASEQLSRKFLPTVFAEDVKPDEFDLIRHVFFIEPRRKQFEDLFTAEQQKVLSLKGFTIDSAYLKSLRWRIEPVVMLQEEIFY